ncbi:MAG: hypothetical protein ACRC2R_08850 [Xenococcaceae cyanobacterium]
MSNEQIISNNTAIELNDEQLDEVAGGSYYCKPQHKPHYPQYGWGNNSKNINLNQNSNAVAFGGNANSSNNAVINA